MWTPIVAKFVTLQGAEEYLAGLNFTWRPSKIVWHNTAAPSLAQWIKTAAEDRAAGRTPGITRIRNLATYFKGRGWPSGPHFFVPNDGIWIFTPPNMKGTHTPSWNGSSIGIEMVADFDREDDDSGEGLKVKNLTIGLTALLCDRLGLSPEIGVVTSKKPLRTTGTIFLHKQDPATTHDCPGKNIARDHEAMVQAVAEYGSHAGGHEPEVTLQDGGKLRMGTVIDVKPGDWLNLRERSSASSRVIGKLANGTKMHVISDGMNGTTKWLYVNSFGKSGWVAARYIKED